jgi:3-oxoacyl-[acyl-carrier protein] reductase
MGSLVGKVAIVTGGSRGIGRAVAERLARDGAAVTVAYASRAPDASETVAAIRQAGGKAVAVQANVARAADVSELFDAAERTFGQAHIVVANAGTMRAGNLVEATVEDYEAVFAINARGTFLTFAEAARRVSDHGRIIGMSTALLRLPRPGIGLYTASKAAVGQLVAVLAKELGPRGVTVNAVAPGLTDTEMLTEASRRSAPQITPLGRVGRPQDIADVVAFLASDDARWINGQVVGANGGMT